MPRKKRTQAEVRRAHVLSQRRGRLKITSFKTEETAISRRVLAFLLWARLQHPEQVMTYEEIAQAVYGFGRLPAAQSAAVKTVKSSLYSVGKTLQKNHGLTLITERGVGARASTDNVDKMMKSLPVVAQRLSTARDNYVTVVHQIDCLGLEQELAEMSGDPKRAKEAAELFAWFQSDVVKLVGVLDRPSTVKGLIPPPPSVDDE